MVSIYNHLYPIQVDLMTKWLENVDVYDQLENISFDYAIMEKIDCGRVLNFPSVWNDVGDWNRISTLIESDKHVAVNSRNTFVKSDRPVIVIGLSDIIVTSTSDGILIASRSHLDSVKHALSIFKISHNEL
jgi:mannose-1-phosphate guanylyltransferase